MQQVRSSRWRSRRRASSTTHSTALVLLRAADGTTVVEFLDEPVRELVVVEGVLPRTAVIIEARQRSIPHIVVEADRSGADLHAFDGGRVLSTDHVEGDSEHIHRGHPGGWSQRRFQQRAENTWERNADDVAAQIVDLANHTGPEMIFVAGDVRAQRMVLDSLPVSLRNITTLITEAGSPAGIADEIVRILSDHVARRQVELVDQVKQRLGEGTASTDADDILASLEAGQVEHLLVHDDGSPGPVTSKPGALIAAGKRVVDAAIAAALRTDAQITIVPSVATLEGPIAALNRW